MLTMKADFIRQITYHNRGSTSIVLALTSP
jgi:hypothetical protein